MKVDERVDDPRPRPPTKKLHSRGADLSSLSIYHVRKTLDWVESLEGTGSEWAAVQRLWCSARAQS